MQGFYIAGKTWHAEKFRFLRDGYELPINSRWIDLQPDSDFVLNQKGALWQMCMEDVRDCSFVLLYCGDPEEEQRGALVEAGAAMALGKRIYCINSCKSLKANYYSDVAFTHHALWTKLQATDLYKGALEALSLEMKRTFRRIA